MTVGEDWRIAFTSCSGVTAQERHQNRISSPTKHRAAPLFCTCLPTNPHLLSLDSRQNALTLLTMFGILEAIKVPEEGVYTSYEELFNDISQRMEKDGYKIVKERSHRARIGGASIPGNDIIRCDLVCNRGGRPYKSSARKHKSSTKKTDCPWKAKAVHRKSAGGWVLTMVCDQHNHEPGTPEPPTPPEHNDADEDDDESWFNPFLLYQITRQS